MNNMGMGDAKGFLDLFDYAEHTGSQHASLLEGVIDGIHNGSTRSERVTVGTIDDYCNRNGINHIDFLKIDVEGYEYKVLHGAEQMIGGNRIDVIQFEFNEMNLVGRTFMRDFFNYLEGKYDIYRLLPHGRLLLQSNEHWFNEQFVYQNILAIRKR